MKDAICIEFGPDLIKDKIQKGDFFFPCLLI